MRVRLSPSRLWRSESWRAAIILAFLLHLCFFSALWGDRTFLESARDSGSIVGEGAWPGKRMPEMKFFKVSDPGAPAWLNEPWFALIGHQYFHEHSLPLWDPYQGYGQPLAANMQSQPFYPLTVLLSVHVTPRTYNWYIALRLFIAGFCAYLFLRYFLSFLAALGGGIACMLGGYYILFITMPHLTVETLVPAGLLVAEYLLRKQTFRAVMAFTMMFLLVVLGGFPESALLLFSLQYAYLTFRVITDGGLRDRWPTLAKCVTAATVAGLGLSAFFLLPFLEYMGRSVNAHDPALLVGPLVGLRHDYPNASALTYLFPLLFGPATNNQLVPGELTLRNYVGLIPFFYISIAIFAAGRRRSDGEEALRRLTWFFLGAGLFVLLKRYGLFGLNSIGYLPVLRMMDFPKYDEAILSVSAAILCGIGLERTVKRQVSVRVQCAALTVAAALLGYALIHPRRVLHDELAALHAVPGLLLFAFAIPACALLLLCVSLLLFHDRTTSRVAGWALLGVLTVELTLNYIGPVYHFYNRLPPQTANPYAGAPFVDFLKREAGEKYRIFGRDGALMPNWASVFGLLDIRDIDGMLSRKYFPFLDVFFPDFLNYTPDLVACFRGLGPFNFRNPLERRLLQISSVRYVASGQPFSTPNWRIEELLRQDKGRLKPGHEDLVSLLNFNMQGNVTETLGEQPPYERLPYRVQVPGTGSAIFDFSYGIDPDAWWRAGDGVRFTVEVRTPTGKVIPVMSHYIDPKHNATERRWQNSHADLSPYKGQEVELLFSTDPGPANNPSFDWSGWSNFHFEGEGVEKTVFTLVHHGDEVVSEYQEAILPRAAIFHHVDVLQNQRQALKRLAAQNFSLLKTVALSTDGLNANEWAAVQEMAQGEGEDAAPATITHYDSDSVQISATLTKPGVLMLNDSDDPGWTVKIDGHSAHWFSADYMFRGVVLEPGNHVVRWLYRPVSFSVGVVISMATALALAVYGFIRRWRRPTTELSAGTSERHAIPA